MSNPRGYVMTPEELAKQREYQKRYCLKHPRKRAESEAKYKEQNRDLLLTKHRVYREQNRDLLLVKHRVEQKKYSAKPENRAKLLAQAQVRKELENDRLIRPEACEQCQKVCKPHAHHDDYTRPLDVRWLCASCHRRHHGAEGGKS